MGVEVSLEDRLGLFEIILQKRIPYSLWLRVLTGQRMIEPYLQRCGSSWP